MSKLLTPLLLIGLAVAVFFVFTNDAYSRAQATGVEKDRYTEAIQKIRELEEVRDNLIDQYNTFSKEDLAKIERMVPNNVDNMRLLIEIDAIASQYGMILRNVQFSDPAEEGEDITIAQDLGRPYDTLTMQFAVAASYPIFKQFLRDLETNARLVDVEEVTFETGETDFNEYSVTLTTYWLRQQ